MAVEPIFLQDEFAAIVSRVDSALFTVLGEHIKFFAGEEEHVIKMMRDIKSSGGIINPLIALEMPIQMSVGNTGGYYSKCVIPRIVIATVTNPNHPPAQRLTDIIKAVVYPMYEELLKKMTKQKSFAIMGKPIHKMQIRYGTQTAAQGFAEYIDGIEMLNTELTLKQNC